MERGSGLPVEPSAERWLHTCLEAEREVVSASRFCFLDWASYWWLTGKGFCCIILSNNEDLIGDLDGQGFSCSRAVVVSFGRPPAELGISPSHCYRYLISSKKAF